MQQLLNILYLTLGAFAAITLHEYIKALVSYKLGDPLPKARGRLSLNPIVHFEPVGFICMLLTGYGWGKPVETAPVYYRDRKKGTILTHITPPVVNLLAGMVFSFAARMLLVYYTSPSGYTGLSLPNAIYALILVLAKSNIAIAFFNFIPVYPLDGAKILEAMLSHEKRVRFAAYEKVFQIILIIAMFTGWVRMLLSPLQSVFLW